MMTDDNEKMQETCNEEIEKNNMSISAGMIVDIFIYIYTK